MPETIPLGVLRAPVDYNPSAKIQFRESGDNISRHKAMIETREFQRAIHYARLQYCRDVANETTDNNKAMASGFKLLAVEEFLKVLLTLAEAPPSAPLRADVGNLNHQA